MFKKILLLGFVVLCVLAFMKRDRILNFFKNDTRTVNKTEVRILFREDPSLAQLIEVLKTEGVIKDDATLQAYIEENAIDTNNFAAGKYVILSQTQMAELVTGFVKNSEGNGNAEIKVNVVFNRCRTLEDIASNISKCILADEASLIATLRNPDVQKKYGFSVEEFPAMFLPKTYEMYFDTDADTFIRFMADRYKEFWTEERKSKMQAIGLSSPSKVSTIASIVYSEQSQMPEEWPTIASVYLNRVKKGMKLESDPTFKFCWGDELDGVERLLNKHKQIDCPYNTYLYAGIPPGPICIPPAEVIDAVLSPANTNYIFMCGKPGGQGHNFASTNAQHERNAAEYRKWLKEYLANKNN